MHLLEVYVPDAKVTFWPHYHYLPKEEVEMLKRRFPKLNIVEGKLDVEGKASNAELESVINQADFFLHCSGPATIGWAEAVAFNKRTGKPYGIYGVSYGLYGTPEKEMLSKAAFVYFRDSVSLAKAKEDGVHANAGYFPFDRLALGIKPKYFFYKDDNTVVTNISYLELGLFSRYYFIKPNPYYNIILQPEYSRSFGKGGGGTKNTYSILAGPVIYFNEYIALEFNIGYTIETLKYDPAKFYTLQSGIGLQIHLTK